MTILAAVAYRIKEARGSPSQYPHIRQLRTIIDQISVVEYRVFDRIVQLDMKGKVAELSKIDQVALAMFLERMEPHKSLFTSCELGTIEACAAKTGVNSTQV